MSPKLGLKFGANNCAEFVLIVPTGSEFVLRPLCPNISKNRFRGNFQISDSKKTFIFKLILKGRWLSVEFENDI